MFDTSPEGIKELVSRGENELVEFKARFPSDRVIAQNLTAFANTNGGILLIGIKEPKEIVGLSEKEAEGTLNRLTKIAESLFTTPIELGTVQIDGRDIVYAIVEKIPSHLFPVSVSSGEIFHREGEANRKMEVELVVPRNELVQDSRTPKKRCKIFVAMSFREEEEPALVDYYQAMIRAVKLTKLPIYLIRIDLVEGDYEISQQIMDEIDQANIVITDFTLSPSNVYFELGYARGVRKRIIQTARKGTKLEFDVRNWRTIFYRNATELEEKLIPELTTAYKDLISKNKR